MEEKPKTSNLKLRFTSGIIISIILLISIIYLPIMLYIIIIIIGTGMLAEWFDITSTSRIDLIIGLIIIPLPIISLLLIFELPNNTWLIITYCLIISSTDSFAMFGGKNIKGPKLAPLISPNKTWSGLISGIIASGIIVFFIAHIPGYILPNNLNKVKWKITFYSMFIALLAQMSDLLESYFKRKYNVKDSGNIIPGHGGILDRFDSIIITAPTLILTLYLL